MNHIPVLLPSVLDSFDLPHRKVIIDATLGLGGHAEGIFRSSEFAGSVIGVDQDASHLSFAQNRLAAFSDRFQSYQKNFSELRDFCEFHDLSFDGILFDLGIASPHLDFPERGFSFQASGPLDMRMDPQQNLTAQTILDEWPENELVRIFSTFGEEPLAQPIARQIVQSRTDSPLTTTTQLAELVSRTYRSFYRKASVKHPATKVFQALRIAVNRELEVLETALKAAVDLIQPGGRILVISYHSLEDRLVKQVFKDAAHPCVCPPKLPVCACGRKPLVRIITKKPIEPSEEEIKKNARARSAKMRVVERI
ncbi:MAG: 16S rRNA (cytosine(1402)-N(4))-methyltransferase RsmH [bacterium]|nr:16S rRNA (cytosine(1402)-N(4))-methyltransferase RsmH [bacterium]